MRVIAAAAAAAGTTVVVIYSAVINLPINLFVRAETLVSYYVILLLFY